MTKLSFDYTLRPKKQVERRMLIELFHKLRAFKYNISKYRYIGFGSIYFYDFILFHKYLYLEDMICFEEENNLKKRMNFNRPYKFIQIKCESFEK